MNVCLEILGLFVLGPISGVITYSTCTAMDNGPKTQVFGLWADCTMIEPRVEHSERSGHRSSMSNGTQPPTSSRTEQDVEGCQTGRLAQKVGDTGFSKRPIIR